jgi:hypothetical protein
MRNFLKHLYHNTTLGNWFLYPIKKLYDYLRPRIVPERTYIRRRFKNTFGYKVNLENPKTFNEKVHWLQLNDRTPLRTLCTDKYAVRGYVKDKIGKQHLIPLVYHSDSAAKIIPENLPDYPFIIKTNHSCGGHIIVRDKTKIDWNITQKKLKKLLKKNYYYKSREWQYKNIKPCIIVEKLLLDENSNIPYDYKFHCFNGKVEVISADIDRHVNSKRNIYDKDWNFIDCRMRFENGIAVKKPKILNKMKSLAEILSNEFIYARVDLYIIGSKIYFGELTFSPAAGFQTIYPEKWDRIFGDKLKL